MAPRDTAARGCGGGSKETDKISLRRAGQVQFDFENTSSTMQAPGAWSWGHACYGVRQAFVIQTRPNLFAVSAMLRADALFVLCAAPRIQGIGSVLLRLSLWTLREPAVS